MTWSALRTLHPKFVEAAGIGLVLGAALWSYYVSEALDTRLRSLESRMINGRFVDVEQLIVAPEALRLKMLKEDMGNYNELETEMKDIRESHAYRFFSWVKFAMYVGGTMLIIGAKVREGLKK